MDQQALRIFLSLAETLHFGRASRQANLSPSALSRAVRRMEEELGQSLFIRDNRSRGADPGRGAASAATRARACRGGKRWPPSSPNIPGTGKR